SLLEPTVQAVAFFFHEKAWDRAAKRKAGDAENVAATHTVVPVMHGA
ncbi:MAG: DUF2061 domain-containing protein, partial [Gammaproteobacteria bacterium]|nr:DUF2061 domain-containing protein [Gammaproteobacteria bacterium]